MCCGISFFLFFQKVILSSLYGSLVEFSNVLRIILMEVVVVVVEELDSGNSCEFDRE